MKVYYGMNFWESTRQVCQTGSGRKKAGEPLQKMRVGREFVWEEISGFIPAVYAGREGVAVDLCLRVSNEAFREFCDKWRERFERGLTEEEQEQMAAENPLNIDFRLELSVNGQGLEADFSCGTCYSKITEDEYQSGGIEEQLVQEYQCGDEASWCFKRYMFRWEQQPEIVQNLDMKFIAGQKVYPGRPIRVDLNSRGKRYEIIHPVNGERYELCIKDIAQQEIDKEILQGRRGRVREWEYPTRYVIVSYCMEPELSPMNFRLHDVAGGDRPRNMSTHENGNVSILIGDTEGPTSIFIAGKKKEKQDMTAASALYFEPVESVVWKPVFMEKEREDLQLHIETENKENPKNMI